MPMPMPMPMPMMHPTQPVNADPIYGIKPEIRFMGIKAMPLVFTSINPGTSIEWQLKCYKSFQYSGHQIVSANHRTEIEILKDKCPTVAVIELADSEVVVQQSGKLLGKVISILKRLLSFDTRDCYVFVNADIYFNGRKACINHLLGNAEAAALTRTDISSYSNIVGLPYHGGLDIFTFTRAGLGETIKQLEKKTDICDEMAIGIPGWDYMVGGTIISAVQGILMDSENLFQHLIHKQTYSGLNSFKSIAAVLHEEGLVKSEEPSCAAAEFSERIKMECRSNAWHARKVAAIYRIFQAGRATESDRIYPRLSDSTNKALLQLYGKADLIFIGRLINIVGPDGFSDFLETKNVFLKGDSFALNVSHLIVCASCILQCAPCPVKFSTNYPNQNSHKICIDLISKVDDAMERNFRLAELFYSELIQYKIFNADIFCYLVSIQVDRLLAGLLKEQYQLIALHLA